MIESPLLIQVWAGFVAGWKEIIDFLAVKAVGAFFPTFFIAGAMATMVSKQTLVRYLSPKHRLFRCYFFAAVSGAFLTVCSCSVLPLFTAFAERGVAAGPAFTFLVATPAINPISMFYAYTLIGPSFGLGMVAVAFFMSITVGVLMSILLPTREEIFEEPEVLLLARSKRRPVHTLVLFALLIAMVFALPIKGIHLWVKAVWVVISILAIRCLVKAKFEAEDVEAWIDKSLDLMKKVLPMILLGIFLTGVLKYSLDPEGRIVHYMSQTGFLTCLVCSVLASLSYMGSILCVSFVKGLLDLGMAKGAAMAILITGPGVSLATVFVVTRSVGKLRAWAYFVLVMLVAALAGWIFGQITS